MDGGSPDRARAYETITAWAEGACRRSRSRRIPVHARCRPLETSHSLNFELRVRETVRRARTIGFLPSGRRSRSLPHPSNVIRDNVLMTVGRLQHELAGMAQLRTRATVGLVLASILLLAEIAAVRGVAERYAYGFLVVNLGLAWIPVAFAAVLAAACTRARLLALVPLGLAFLVFLPNAPYLVTDLVHAGEQPPHVPLGVDLAILVTAATCGTLAWATSLRLFQLALRSRFGPLTVRITVLSAGALAGVGICVGRILRWNSWDVITRPATLVNDAVAALGDPLAHARGFSAMLLAGALLGALALAQSFAGDRRAYKSHLPTNRRDRTL